MDHLKICVAIPTYNREKVLLETLEQVLALDPPADEIIIVDQTEKHLEETEKYLSEKHNLNLIKWIRLSTANLPAARNRAVNESLSDIIIFIDDDIFIPSDFILHFRNIFSDNNINCVLGNVIQPKNSNEIFSREFVFNNLNIIDEAILKTGDKVDFLRGGNFGIRKNTYIRAGGFDENFIGSANYEENDFAKRLLSKGEKIIFCKEAKIFHRKVDDGGCRALDKRKEYEFTLPFLIYFIRYNKNRDLNPYYILRSGPLRKKNVIKIWRQPYAWFSFIYSIIIAIKRVKSGVKSPFVNK